ncbi:MAG: efflux RND transporter permease subunit [Candidatus Omnitrophota bacterium]|nr:MAG: efflux RND transporter permease subunit [Candidatus Omnitrophota bacterium]
MKFSEFSVKNSLFVNLFSAFIIISGIVSVINLRKEAFPVVSFNRVLVTTALRGASPEKIERLVTIPLERELREVENIDEMISSSTEGESYISLNVDDKVKDLQKVVNDIQKAVDRVTDLPDDIEERPLVKDITSSEIPVLKIALSGELNEFVLRRYADNLKDLIEDIEEVASVARTGWRDEEYWIEPDIAKMKEYHISFYELAIAVKAQNVDMPGGKQEYDGKEFMVKVKGELKTKEDIENTVIRSSDLGNWVKVKDVANVRHTFQDDIILNKSLGTRAITFTVVKREAGDIIRLVSKVHKVIKEFKKNVPQILKISTFYDLSYYVKRRLNVLRSNGVIGFCLVVLTLFLFLPPLSAFVTALGIPIAFFTTFGIMYFMGVTINLLTMFGLVMVLGMIVDDGIIISENVCRNIENGMPPKEAAIKGTNEVFRPVLATVLTTMIAFSPLMFMGGLIGRFVKFIPLIVIIALSASLVEAFIILPSHLADFARPSNLKGGRKENPWLKWLSVKYTSILEKAIKSRYKVVGVVFAIFIASLILARIFMPFVLFSARGVEQFSIYLEGTTGNSLEKTNELIAPMEEIVDKLPAEYLDTYETLVGYIGEERGYDPNEKRGSNFAQIRVYLTPAAKRDKTAEQIIDMMRPQTEALFEKLKPQGVEKLYFYEFREGPPVGRAVDARVRGVNIEIIKEITDKMKAYLARLEGIKDISDSYSLGAKEIDIIIDEEKAQKAYLTNAKIAFAIRASFSGVVATTIKQEKAEKEILVLVRLPQEQRNEEAVFENIVVENNFGALIPLKEVTKRTYSQGLRSIKHMDGKRFISILADVDNKKMTSLKAKNLIIKYFKSISAQYPGYSLRFSGEAKETMESLGNLGKAFLLAALFVFLILATQFNSLIQPFIIMLTIPFGIIGFIVAFLLHGEPLGFLAIMGFVGLCGVVVNDSIVLVDFINKRRHYESLKEAVIEAGQVRLRPVLITTVTTVVGLATVAYGIGGLDPFLRPMALAISWGLMFGTILTLIMIPCTYLIVEDIKNLIKKHNENNRYKASAA